MGVTKVPGIWDYLAGGADRYLEGRDKRRQQQIQQATMMEQLYGAGAIDASELTPALQAAGINATIKPNQAERQRQIVQSPDLNPTTGKPWTTDERKMAGMGSLADVAEEDAKYKYLMGGEITPRQAAALKLPDDDEIAAGKELVADKRFSVVGPRYVDMIIAEQGGISAKNAGAVIDKAFQRWASDRRAAGLPVSPSDRSYFSSQVMERLEKSRSLAVQEAYAARSGQGGGTMGMSADMMKMYQRYQTDLKNAQDAETRLLSNPQLAMFLQAAQTNPQYAENPLVKQYYAAVRAKETAQQNLDMVQYGPQGRQPLGPTVATPAPAGGTGAVLPAYGSGRQGTAPAPASPRADQMAAALMRGEGTIDQIRELYTQKKISAAEYLRIKQIVGIYDKPTRK